MPTSTSAAADRCSSCLSRLASDQRYCIVCGARRGAQPAYVAEAIAALLEQGREVPVPARVKPAATPAGALGGLSMPSPRAAAVGVMGMLSFGVIAGSIAGPTFAGDVARGPLIVVVEGARSAAAAAASLAGSDASPSAPAPATPLAGAPTSAAAVRPPAALTVTAPGAPAGPVGPSAPANLYNLPAIKHVFLIVLSGHGYSETFGAGSSDAYLGRTLPARGELLQNYYAVAPSPLANEIALISGQGPTDATAADCPTYTDIRPGTRDAKGLVKGRGCVYPAATKTIAQGKLTWRAYVGGMGPSCRHPRLGSRDNAPAGGYATFRNPWMYFHSVIDKPRCKQNDVDLGRLGHDLAGTASTAAFSLIMPSACENGDPTPCRAGAPAGLPAAERFLRRILPQIEASPAYKADGLIAVTFDGAPQNGPHTDSRACCDNPTSYPNLTTTTGSGTTTEPQATTNPTAPTTTTTTTTTAPLLTTPSVTTPVTTVPPVGSGLTTTTTTTTTATTTTSTTPGDTTTTTTPTGLGDGNTTPTGGGGQVGMVLLTRYVKPGTVDSTDYFNHFSFLATLCHLFGVGTFGYAADPALPALGGSVFNRPTG